MMKILCLNPASQVLMEVFLSKEDDKTCFIQLDLYLKIFRHRVYEAPFIFFV